MTRQTQVLCLANAILIVLCNACAPAPTSDDGGDNEFGDECDTDDDCSTGLVCLAFEDTKLCSIACANDDGCAEFDIDEADGKCGDGVCFWAANDGLGFAAVCESDDQCEDGFVCLDAGGDGDDVCDGSVKFCTKTCTTQTDCDDLGTTAVCAQMCEETPNACMATG